MRCRDAGKRTMTDWHKRTSVNFTALLKPAGRFFEGMSMLHFKSVIMDEPAVMRALRRRVEAEDPDFCTVLEEVEILERAAEKLFR